jgi:hypothetical protein
VASARQLLLLPLLLLLVAPVALNCHMVPETAS